MCLYYCNCLSQLKCIVKKCMSLSILIVEKVYFVLTKMMAVILDFYYRHPFQPLLIFIAKLLWSLVEIISCEPITLSLTLKMWATNYNCFKFKLFPKYCQHKNMFGLRTWNIQIKHSDQLAIFLLTLRNKTTHETFSFLKQGLLLLKVIFQTCNIRWSIWWYF